jgi:trimeric autotransporter adhesin
MASNGGAAYGDGAAATGSLATALGPNASTTAANAVAIGSGSVANEDDSVSVGAPGNHRRITNVANGIAPTDAVTVGQVLSLRALIDDVRRECGLPAQTARANGE